MRGLGLDGKVVIVTGSGRPKGLGQGILQRFADEGCNCVVSDVGTSDQMEDVAEELRTRGAGVLALNCDVTQEEQVEELIAKTVAEFGRIDVLVNNAGVGSLMKPLIEITLDDWQKVLNVNLMGAFLTTKHAALHMMKQNESAKEHRGGAILNIASQAAKSGVAHMAAYAASKHGMIGLTRSAALEFGPHGIRVNAVCPNYVPTETGKQQSDYFSTFFGLSVKEYMADMERNIPMRRMGLVADTAAACAFLASEQADYITGEALNVTGGAVMY